MSLTMNAALMIFILTQAIALIVAAFKLVWWASQMSAQLTTVVSVVSQVKESLEKGTGPTCRDHTAEILRLKERIEVIEEELRFERDK